MNILTYSFCTYFFFYLICHADILSVLRQELFTKLPTVALYVLNCAFCFTFWVSVPIVLGLNLPFYYVLGSPVINLLIDSLYRGLNGGNKQE